MLATARARARVHRASCASSEHLIARSVDQGVVMLPPARGGTAFANQILMGGAQRFIPTCVAPSEAARSSEVDSTAPMGGGDGPPQVSIHTFGVDVGSRCGPTRGQSISGSPPSEAEVGDANVQAKSSTGRCAHRESLAKSLVMVEVRLRIEPVARRSLGACAADFAVRVFLIPVGSVDESDLQIFLGTGRSMLNRWPKQVQSYRWGMPISMVSLRTDGTISWLNTLHIQRPWSVLSIAKLTFGA